MSKLKILLVFGTRPEAIKMAPLFLEFKKFSHQVEVRVCVTAQHREMLDQVISFFGIKVHYDLDLMKPNQNLYSLTSTIIEGMKSVIEDFNPNYLFVHGDTTTSMAAAIAGFYGGVKIVHVEAGLRTHNKYAPFPEEMNRSITSRIADIHFAPTITAKKNLLQENIEDSQIIVTGNTVIDALLYGIKLVENSIPNSIQLLQKRFNFQRPMILVTGHRRENFGDGFLNICKALREIAIESEVDIIYPVHLNPNVQKPVYEILSGIKNIHLIDPQPYESFIWLMDKAKIVITDSGGIQEEAPSLGKPVLVMRETTERPEAVESGTVILVGTDTKKIVSETIDLLNNNIRYDSMSRLHNPYGDGKASLRIVEYFLTKTT